MAYSIKNWVFLEYVLSLGLVSYLAAAVVVIVVAVVRFILEMFNKALIFAIGECPVFSLLSPSWN